MLIGEDRDDISDGDDNGGVGEFWDNDNDNDYNGKKNDENRMQNILHENVLPGDGKGFCNADMADLRGQNRSPGVKSGTDIFNPFDVRTKN